MTPVLYVLKSVLDIFNRVDALGDHEAEELTSGLASGLRSWLTFGSSLSAGGLEMENRMNSFLQQTELALRQVSNMIHAAGSEDFFDDRRTDDLSEYSVTVSRPRGSIEDT